MIARRTFGHAPDRALHLGNYVGALGGWVRLQNEGWNNSTLADWTCYDRARGQPSLQSDIYEGDDWLAAGLIRG